MSKLCSLTTPTPSPRTAAPPGKRSTVTLCTQAPMRLACNVKYVGQPRPPLRPQERPSHPSPSASGRVPLLETPLFQPRFDCPPSQHLREGGGRSQQYRNGPAVSTIRGPFPPPPLLQQRPADTESSIPQRRLGDAPLHHRPHRYNTVMSAPLRHPSVACTEHIDTLSAGGPRHRRSPAMELSYHVDVSVHTGPQPTLPSTHSKPALSCTPIAPITGGGGGGGVQRRHSCNASLQCVSSSVF